MTKRIRRPKISLEMNPEKREEIREAAKLHNRTITNFCLTCIEQKLREIRQVKKK